MKVNFLTTNTSHEFLNKKIIENKKSNIDYQKEEFQRDIAFENDFADELIDIKTDHKNK